MEITAGHYPQGKFRYLQFGLSSKSRAESAIVYLHGAGERGKELSLVTRYGLPAMLAEGRAVTNCDVVCPQLEEDAVWHPDRVAGFIEAVGAGYESVSLIGFSLGASGVCSLTAAHGAVVAFAMAIAGQGPVSVQVSQAGVRLLAIQGELDPWPDTGNFLSSVRSAGGLAVDVRIAGQGHFISEAALADPTAISMLLEAGVRIAAANAPWQEAAAD